MASGKRNTIRIGTRGSKLALAQSMWVKDSIESRHKDLRVELVSIKTLGDKILDVPLSKVGGKGLFVKEIEDALLQGAIDLAVHSMKDVPAELPQGLSLAAFPEREDPRDAVISAGNLDIVDLPRGARVGTSSLRRIAQLLRMRKDLSIVSLRGNVDTRIRRLENGELDAIVLASAGLRRLGYSMRISSLLDKELFLPAVGQGALGIEVRRDDRFAVEAVAFLNHETTECAVRAERAFLSELEGGCQVPIACHAEVHGDAVRICGMVAELDGSRVIKDELTVERALPESGGTQLARKLKTQGAWEILSRIYSGS
ncbi:MAG: hydroxymethylbilane synthase [Desulfobacteraceae bacterium]|jgi:hydroxymethylbilane synthase|nr:MAG: hydroxymethylbilane synthase [Desulfobacteraceae bacterium]